MAPEIRISLEKVVGIANSIPITAAIRTAAEA